MTGDESERSLVTRSWDVFWQGAHSSAAYARDGATHPVIRKFWNDYFRGLRGSRGALKLIDVASGNGAVAECAMAAFERAPPMLTCLDASEAAAHALRRRFPAARAIVGDAARIPLQSGSYDIATSQFGIEYAGARALDEMTRLLAGGGELALLLHHRDGPIHRQCSASLDAISGMRAANFIPHCIATFEAGFAALRGGDVQRYRAAGREFASAIRAVETIMTRHGRDVADGAILRLYRDVRNIHGSIADYEPSDVLAWLRKMEEEIEAYAERIRAMQEAAVDETLFERLCAGLVEARLEILRGEPLADAAAREPLAWALVARKR